VSAIFVTGGGEASCLEFAFLRCFACVALVLISKLVQKLWISSDNN